MPRATLRAAAGTAPATGPWTLNSNGSFTYTPTANYNGTDTFTYRASDGSLTSNLATVTITINAVNDAPTLAVAAGGTCGRQRPMRGRSTSLWAMSTAGR